MAHSRRQFLRVSVLGLGSVTVASLLAACGGAGPNAVPGKPETKPAESKPAESKPAESKPAVESKPPVETKPADKVKDKVLEMEANPYKRGE
jgi:predicted small lipoprotein YifL